MSDPINLRRARKRKARSAKERSARANRLGEALTKAEREALMKEAALKARRLAGARLDKPESR